MADIILASQSPRRKTLLEWANIPFEIVVSDSDETFPETMTKQDVPVYIASNKANFLKKKDCVLRLPRMQCPLHPA